MSEGIAKQENREFTASLGNWTGDATWEAGPIGGYSGVAKLVSPLQGNIKTTSLSYPNLITQKGKDTEIFIQIYLAGPAAGIPQSAIRITDGVHSYDLPISLPNEEVWDLYSYPLILPAGWNKNNAILSFDFESGDPFNPATAYFDLASVVWMSPKQYLPIVGIG